jgi:cysteine desulfurase
LGKACELAGEAFEDEWIRVRNLRDRLEEALLFSCKGAKLNGHKRNRLANTSSISFEYVEGEAILLLLDRLGICGSSGSACTSGSLEPSHVLRAMGVPFTSAHGSVRLSLSRYNTEQDIDYVIEHMPGIIEKLRDISPFGRDKTGSD